MSKHDDDILLSPKHGVNPCIKICAWCGKEDGIALLGKLKGDIEAPRSAILDYEPCKNCKAKMAEGVTVTEITNTPRVKGQPPLTKDPDGNPVYATGRWVVFNESAFKDEANIKKGDRTIMSEEEFAEIVNNFPEDKEPDTPNNTIEFPKGTVDPSAN